MAKKEQKKVKKEVKTLIDTPKVVVDTPVGSENEMPAQVKPETEPVISEVKSDVTKDVISALPDKEAFLTLANAGIERTLEITPGGDDIAVKTNNFAKLKPLGEQMMNLLSVESAIELVCAKYERCIDTARGTSVIPGAMEHFLKYNQMRIKFIDKIEKLIDEDKWIKDFLKD